MENAFGTNILNGPGTVMMASPQSVACAAFAAAVDKWCAKKPGDRKGSFNDYFFKELESDNPKGGKAFAASMRREVPMLADRRSMQTLEQRRDAVANRLQQAQQAQQNATNRSQRSRAGRAVRSERSRLNLYNRVIARDQSLRDQFTSGSLTDSQYRRESNNNVRRLQRHQVRYPDAMHDGTPVEIKGPGDNWGTKVSPRSGGTQKDDYQKYRKDGKVIEVSCQSCSNANCKQGHCK